ncbi:hypothetical protein JIR23_01535 [Bradyrhizobium diazoefficiens]|nr:hypothetical protein [Bradyrhizobium diazoefficiens]QQN64538.1 hypothetical protein JIR23_01535 [Bradyrhizobium diazoefficiens]
MTKLIGITSTAGVAVGDLILAVDTLRLPAGVECRLRISAAARKIDAYDGKWKRGVVELDGRKCHELTGSNRHRRSPPWSRSNSDFNAPRRRRKT